MLDLARALSAAWVLGAHLCFLQGWPVYPFYEGRIPVDVFIFLSGFLMYHILSRQQADLSVGGVLSFYTRRFFRIAPCFYLALLAYAYFREFYVRELIRVEDHFGMHATFTRYIFPLTTKDILIHVAFLHGVWPGRATKAFGPAWSLSLEMQFYAVAPFLAFWLKRRPAITLWIGFLINAMAWVLVGSYGHMGLLGRHPFPSYLSDRIFLFCFGASACLYHSDSTRRHGWLLAASTVGSFLLFPTDSMVLCVALIVFLLIIQRAPEQSAARWLQRVASLAIVGLAAEWSYSIYLIHQFCFSLSAWLLGRWLLPGQASAATVCAFTGTTVVIATAIAALMFYLVERPARDWGKGLVDRFLPLKRHSSAPIPQTP